MGGFYKRNLTKTLQKFTKYSQAFQIQSTPLKHKEFANIIKGRNNQVLITPKLNLHQF